jgi:hypothetical protein
MQTWEYKAEYLRIMPGLNKADEQNAMRVLNERGMEGWELVAVSPLGDTGSFLVTFKRPVR